VHMLSTGAFNALLKTLEEPPENVIFILATTELNKVPSTIKSRCVMFSFRKVSEPALFEHVSNILKLEKLELEEPAIKLLCREAKGSVRDVLSLLEQVIAFSRSFSISQFNQIKIEHVREALGLQVQELGEKLFLSVAAKNILDSLKILEDVDLRNLDFMDLMEQAAISCQKYLLDTNRETSPAISKAAHSEIFRVFSKCARDISKTTLPKHWCEVAVLDAIDRADWLSVSEFFSAQNFHNEVKPAEVKPVEDKLPRFLKFVEHCELHPKFPKSVIAKLSLAQVVEFNTQALVLKGAELSQQELILVKEMMSEFGMPNVHVNVEVSVKENQKVGKELENKLSFLVELQKKEDTPANTDFNAEKKK
jgi:DNA polymerase III gamma/tau subunit